ncbi:collagen alpha-1(I) chain isoform X2 [Gadus morhua]|uniref:collagen alpha-1(I) chain isoform X2 n=1 Tax=Gadus morhua TaxID=8049 RepID=UPI0011B7FBAB|nr:collagen alpha-1(I) chain-like isoform X2 [Gadus morhua]
MAAAASAERPAEAKEMCPGSGPLLRLRSASDPQARAPTGELKCPAGCGGDLPGPGPAALPRCGLSACLRCFQRPRSGPRCRLRGSCRRPGSETGPAVEPEPWEPSRRSRPERCRSRLDRRKDSSEAGSQGSRCGGMTSDQQSKVKRLPEESELYCVGGRRREAAVPPAVVRDERGGGETQLCGGDPAVLREQPGRLLARQRRPPVGLARPGDLLPPPRPAGAQRQPREQRQHLGGAQPLQAHRVLPLHAAPAPGRRPAAGARRRQVHAAEPAAGAAEPHQLPGQPSRAAQVAADRAGPPEPEGHLQGHADLQPAGGPGGGPPRPGSVPAARAAPGVRAGGGTGGPQEDGGEGPARPLEEQDPGAPPPQRDGDAGPPGPQERQAHPEDPAHGAAAAGREEGPGPAAAGPPRGPRGPLPPRPAGPAGPHPGPASPHAAGL